MKRLDKMIVKDVVGKAITDVVFYKKKKENIFKRIGNKIVYLSGKITIKFISILSVFKNRKNIKKKKKK